MNHEISDIAVWHAPSVFWFVGGMDADLYTKAEAENCLNEIPTNHNPRFAPVIHPTLETGVATLITATHVWMAVDEDLSEASRNTSEE
jgi:hippurate hydrolase